MLLIPAAFTAFTGKDHWQVLLQSRAIENTAYVVAPAQTGLHYRRRQSHGHAMIIDPWGEVLAEVENETGIAVAKIDIDKLICLRKSFPTLTHRKLDYNINE